MHRPIIIWGASGHAKVLAEFLPGLGYGIVAFFDRSILESPVPGVECFQGKEGFQRWKKNTPDFTRTKFLIAIGGAHGNDRLELQEYLSAEGLQPATVIHPTAFVAQDVQIGAGTQILAQAAVCAGAKIGRASIINTKASVDHECILGDGVHIAPGATLAGCVTVGDCAFIALAANILPRISIGKNSTVGAGALVIENVPDNVVVTGLPAKFHRTLNDANT